MQSRLWQKIMVSFIVIYLLANGIVCIPGTTVSAQIFSQNTSTVTTGKPSAGQENNSYHAKADNPGTPAPASSANTAPAGNEVDKTYVIGAEDVLEISVWQNEDLSRTVTVRPDGKISLPLINDVQAAGLTTDQLKRALIAKLKPFAQSPDVAVIVQQINSWKIFIQGEVNSPGVFSLRSNTTISQAITMAGGFTEYAKKRKIQVIRNILGSQGKEIIKINYNKIISGRDMSQDIYLKPGDTIIIP